MSTLQKKRHFGLKIQFHCYLDNTIFKFVL